MTLEDSRKRWPHGAFVYLREEKPPITTGPIEESVGSTNEKFVVSYFKIVGPPSRVKVGPFVPLEIKINVDHFLKDQETGIDHLKWNAAGTELPRSGKLLSNEKLSKAL
eukprot:7121591-Prymnesium_polylepis.1